MYINNSPFYASKNSEWLYGVMRAQNRSQRFGKNYYSTHLGNRQSISQYHSLSQ